MKKKASMMSTIAFLIAIIFIALVLYKVFTFAVEQTPEIQIRQTANKIDYALNAPEDVEIIHVFPASVMEGCGIGAIMFKVDEVGSDIIDGSHMAILVVVKVVLNILMQG